MTVNSPDRAPIRAIILLSVTDTLAVISKLVSPNDSSAPTTAVNHYISFLSALARSSKVSHRAFSLDVSTAVLNTDWVWALTPVGESSSSGAGTLLSTLVSRSNDASPSVRMRSLNSIHDLLVNLSDSSAPAVVSILYELVVTDASRSNAAEDSISLLDTLRIRCDDEKPLVRAKALQCLCTALTVVWPSVDQSSSGSEVFQSDDPDLFPPLETISAHSAAAVKSTSPSHIADDDICVFIDHCSDLSLSARKQALTCLTDLLQARPSG